MDMVHRLIAPTLILLILFGSPAFALEKQLDTGVSFTWFNNDNSDKGTQVAVPIHAEFVYGGFKGQLVNAFAYTSIKPDEGDSVSLSRFLDTKINLSYEVLGRPPADFLVGCGFNLPTGYTDFKADELALVSLPPDLLPISSFGEGFNINPYLGVSKEWERLAAGFGMGYQWRGKYDYSEMIQDLDPGDVLTVTAEATYALAEELQGRVLGEYASYGKDKVDGNNYYKEGALTLLGMGITYTRPSWKMDADLTGIYRAKDKYYTAVATPINSEKNYGDEWQASLKHTCFLNSTTSVISHLGFLTIAKNGFTKDSPYYAGGRQKISLGGGMEKEFTKGIKGDFDLTLFTLKDKQNWNHPGEDLSYKGFTLSAGLNMAF
jgi:hypothetical protein